MAKRKASELDDMGEIIVKKHTLDSDEEDDTDQTKYEIMEEDDIEGQEDATIEFDGDIKITPFNMKEELEEGHFDKQGNYFLKKQEQIKDSWLDNIDWAKVHSKSKTGESGGDGDKADDSSSDSDSYEQVDELETYKQMLTYMQPKENILRAIKRLGGRGSHRANASSRWNLKKPSAKTSRKSQAAATQTSAAEQTTTTVAADVADTSRLTQSVETVAETAKETAPPTEEDEGTRQMLALTELANRMLHSGRLEIYNETYERLSYVVRQRTAAKDTSHVADMFGDDFEEKVSEPRAGSSKEEEPAASSRHGVEASDEAVTSAQIMWEFKWEDSEAAKVYGPHPTAEMQQWVDDGYFADGVFVRRSDQPEASFYTSKRIDFELYM